MLQVLLRRAVASAFLKDAAKLSSGVFVAQLIALAASPLLTRLFAPEVFGVFAIIFSIATTVALFGTLRIENLLPIISRPAISLGLLSFILLLSLSTALILAAIIALAGPAIAAFCGLDQSQAPLLYAIPVFVVITCSNLGLRAWMIRKKRFSAIGRSQVLRSLLNIGVSLALGFAKFPAHMPATGLIAGHISGDVVFTGQLGLALRKRERYVLLRPRVARILQELRRRRSQIATQFATQAVSMLYGRMPLIVIGAIFGPVHAGWYALAERVCQAPCALISNAIGDVFRNRASELFRDGKPFDQLLRRLLTYTMALSIIPFALVIALATPYFGTVFGEQWHDAGSTVAIMLVGTFFFFNQSPIAYASMVHEANTFLYTWHGIRFVGECAAAWLAYQGYVGYIGYLSLVVALRSALSVWDMFVENSLAKKVVRRAAAQS